MLHSKRIDEKLDRASDLSLTNPEEARAILRRISIHRCSAEQRTRRYQMLTAISKRLRKQPLYELMKDIIDSAIESIERCFYSKPELYEKLTEYKEREKERRRKLEKRKLKEQENRKRR